MISLNKSQGFWLTFRQLICLTLSIGMVLIGFPIGVLGQDKGIPVKLIFVERDLTDKLTAGPTGMPRGHNPNTRLRVKAILLDAKGNDVTNKCRIVYNEHNPLSGDVVKVYQDDEGAELAIGAARGAARVTATAWCKDDQLKDYQLKDHLLVTGNGGKGPFEPTEIRSWLEKSPPQLRFSQSQRRYLEAQAKKIATPTPVPPPPTKKTAGKRSGKKAAHAIGAGLALGAALAGATALAIALSGGVGGGGTQIGGGGGTSGSSRTCKNPKFPCENKWMSDGYVLCCPRDFPYARRENKKCYKTWSDAYVGTPYTVTVPGFRKCY